MKKNFWNNWDFKTIVLIVIFVSTAIYNQATSNAKVEHLQEQRNKDVETVKLIRDNDMKSIGDDIKQLLDMVKELRDELRGKKDK